MYGRGSTRKNFSVLYVVLLAVLSYLDQYTGDNRVCGKEVVSRGLKNESKSEIRQYIVVILH